MTDVVLASVFNACICSRSMLCNLVLEWRIMSSVHVQATEADLWAVFSPVGEILELYVLRGPNGLSRGCGFITYANKFLAQQAIMSNNGKQMGSKVLVVKFADRSVPNKLM